MSWKLWGWQRFQQLTGALLVLLPAGTFFIYLANGQLPGDDFRRDIPVSALDHREIDHVHIAVAIGSCQTPVSPAKWSDQWLGTLRLDRPILHFASSSLAPLVDSRSPDAASQSIAGDLTREDLTAFERAAIYHSDRGRGECYPATAPQSHPLPAIDVDL